MLDIFGGATPSLLLFATFLCLMETNQQANFHLFIVLLFGN